MAALDSFHMSEHAAKKSVRYNATSEKSGAGKTDWHDSLISWTIALSLIGRRLRYSFGECQMWSTSLERCRGSR
jgi:hypothetical protein